MPGAEGRIGHIRLVETLGEGGMGTVWAGFDEKLRREVAVKTIRGDRVDLETRARLLAEARILSRLEHPNICRLHDFVEGEDSDYLVLERIRGRTLTEAIRAGIGAREKLRIAEEIARTLVVAHSRGIVHRDLKPSNVMLAEEGEPGRDRVKVLDFGLARSLDAPEPRSPADRPAGDRRRAPTGATPIDGTLTRLASAVLRGEAGRVTGTPANMSPEQARGESATAASDMYSFGLLLQELFTGRPAYPTDLLADRLLTKVADGDTLPVEGVDRDVRALVERLLALAPEDRPAASETAARLRRIRERPKRRRRWLAAAAVAATVLGGSVKYTLDLQHERRQAVAARDAAEEARREAEQVTEFMVELFEVSDPTEARGREVTAREVLDRGAERIAGELEDQPRVRARILSTMGVVYRSLGKYERAMELESEALEIRREVYGDESLESAESLENLGAHTSALGRHAEAQRLFERVLEIRRRTQGADHADLATTLNNLATVHYDQGDLESAEALQRRALAIRERAFGSGHARVGRDLKNLAVLVGQRGDPEEAEALFLRALEIYERSHEPDHPDLATLLQSLATLLYRQGELDRAEALYRRTLAIRERVLGSGHRDTAITAYSLAACYNRQGELERAEPLYLRALETMEGALGPDHPYTVRFLAGIAEFYRAQGDLERAEHFTRRARESRSESPLPSS